jgi:TPR repeat protein
MSWSPQEHCRSWRRKETRTLSFDWDIGLPSQGQAPGEPETSVQHVAQYNLALGYRDGLGVPRSPRIAVKWLRVSAAAGNADAQNDLGYCLHEGLGVGKERREAFRWYLRAARQGLIQAQFNVGLCYRDGDGIKASKLKARQWLQKAARRGHGPAREVLTGIL